MDAVKPKVTTTQPVDGAAYRLGKVQKAKYKCTDNESGIDTCVGDVASGSPIDTSTVGRHTFTFTGSDRSAT